MSNPTCDEARELAPEVVLGIAGGEERARVLEHLGGCSSCRAYVSDLAEVGESLLLLVPPKEPPAGFENRALARMTPVRRGPRRRLVASLAAAAVAAGVTSVAMLAATRSDRTLAGHTREVLGQADGKSFTAARLNGPSGPAGEVFVYVGSPSWLFVSVDAHTAVERLDVLLVLRDGTTETIGRMRLQVGAGNWGGAAPVSLETLAAVRLVDESGSALFHATFSGA